ncbi:hypothetical protein ACIQD5_35740 [Streptomyces microflavus]|uniref:hypothetical protein n=1 Tax=Streptomyces microflavus TaxID=1919 RepID=UPI0038145921
MDTADVIAIVAVTVAVVAAGISIQQAKSAKRSADQAVEQVAAAREANRLTRLQIDQQTAKDHQAAREGEQASQREAEKVEIGLGGNGGSVFVTITNATRMITGVELLDVTALGDGPWRSWKTNSNVGRVLSTTQWPRIDHGDRKEVAVWLLDEQGKHIRQLPEKARVKIRFRDDEGQWWEAEIDENGRKTTRIAPPND